MSEIVILGTESAYPVVNRSENHDVVKLYGVMGNNCGHVEHYSGRNKRLQEKGFVVNGGIPTIRGYAKASDLAAISHAKYADYQRERDGGHIGEIKEFLINGKRFNSK